MPINMNYKEYSLTKTTDDKNWCANCLENTDNIILLPDDRFMPAFIICWNCHSVSQVGVGFLRAAEHRNEAEKEQPCPMCDGKGYNMDTGRVVWCEVCYGTGQV